MKTLTPQDIRELTGNGGEFFRVGFIKRTNGEYREMTCRFGVQKELKGGQRAYDFDEKNVLGVWIPERDRREDGKDKGYRVVPCENVTILKAHGKVWNVENGVLVEQS